MLRMRRNLPLWSGPEGAAFPVMTTTTDVYRRALVIGNSAYQAAQALRNPVNDADLLGAKLQADRKSVV